MGSLAIRFGMALVAGSIRFSVVSDDATVPTVQVERLAGTDRRGHCRPQAIENRRLSMTAASDYHLQQARALNAAGRSAEAAAAARRGVALDPRDAEAWYQLGTALRNQGQLENAISVYKQVVAL